MWKKIVPFWKSIPQHWKSGASIVARLILGGIWIAAGATKVTDPGASVSAVRAYQILPTDVAELVGRVLPTAEIILGVCILAGLLLRFSGALSALLQVAFIVGISSLWIRGIAIDCGCFGDGGYDPDAFSKYPWEIARDIGLLLLSLWLAGGPSSPWTLDRLLFRSTEESDVEEIE